MRRIRVIERAEEFPQVRGMWEEAAREARARRPASTRAMQSPTLFQSYEWNEIAARMFAEREGPYVVVAESDSGAAIIPACVRRDSVSLLGEELFDYRDVIAAGDESLLELGWENIAELGKPLEVKAVRGERSWAEMRPFAGAPYLPCSVPLKRNKGLERNLRLLGGRGCVLRATGTAGEIFQSDDPVIGRSGDLVRRMYELKGQQESGSLFRDRLRIEVVAQMAASADTEVFTIDKDGDLVAAVLTFVDGDVCRFYGTYYDERFSAYSPGVSLLYRVIQQTQARGLNFDFMTGEHAYKMRLASEVVPLYTAHVPAAVALAA